MRRPIYGCHCPTHSVAHRLLVRDRGATSVNASGSRYRHKQVFRELQQQSWKDIRPNVIPVYSRRYFTYETYTEKSILASPRFVNGVRGWRINVAMKSIAHF
jgi:hypothetical protein